MAETGKAVPTAKRAAPKRKTAAKRKPVAKRKPAVKRKTAARVEKAGAEFSSRAKEGGRSAYLVGLGCYGMAYDSVSSQINGLQGRMESSKKKADKLYKELVKRGEKVEKEAKRAVDDIHLPKLELDKLGDRKALESRMNKAKARFEELKNSVSARFAA